MFKFCKDCFLFLAFWGGSINCGTSHVTEYSEDDGDWIRLVRLNFGNFLFLKIIFLLSPLYSCSFILYSFLHLLFGVCVSILIIYVRARMVLTVTRKVSH